MGSPRRVMLEWARKHATKRGFPPETKKRIHIAIDGEVCLMQGKLLGSSEIIESVFGKLKRIEGDQEKSGFTGNVLQTSVFLHFF